MNKSNFYVLGRHDGLKVLRSDLGKREKNQIIKNCFDIRCDCGDEPAIVICPLSNGQIAVSSSRKIEGSCLEKRRHEETQGFLVEEKLFIGMMPYLCGKRQDCPLFLQEPLEDNLELLTDEQLSLPDYDYSIIEEESYDDSQTQKLINSLKYILDSEKKYWIYDLDPQEGLNLQVKLHYIGHMILNKSFYSISNGELPKPLPKLLIVNNLNTFYNKKVYEDLTYDQFIALGNEKKENGLLENNSKEDNDEISDFNFFEQKEFEENQVIEAKSPQEFCDEMLEEVRTYYLGHSTMKSLLKKRQQLKPFSTEWIYFRTVLRKMLLDSKEIDLEKAFYLVLLAFEKTSEESLDETALPVSLYNEKEMFDFLAKLTDNKKELYYFYNLYIEKTVNRSVGIYGKKRFLKRLMSRNILLKCGGIIWNKNQKRDN